MALAHGEDHGSNKMTSASIHATHSSGRSWWSPQ